MIGELTKPFIDNFAEVIRSILYASTIEPTETGGSSAANDDTLRERQTLSIQASGVASQTFRYIMPEITPSITQIDSIFDPLLQQASEELKKLGGDSIVTDITPHELFPGFLVMTYSSDSPDVDLIELGRQFTFEWLVNQDHQFIRSVSFQPRFY